MAFQFGKRREMPTGLWTRCEGCSVTVFRKAVEDRLHVCPECGYHFRIPARTRLDYFLDSGSFEEFDKNLRSMDPLSFVDEKPYKVRLAQMQEATGLADAIVTGKGRVQGQEIVVGAMDPNFIIASLGVVIGEKVSRAAERAMQGRLPLVIFCAGGGARMQEGMAALMQMAKTATVIKRLQDNGGLYISVLTNPTYAGTLASFASLGDIIIAEPKAMIGFTGPRVIRETIRAELPQGFQSAEFHLEHGFVDLIVPRAEMPSRIARIIDYCKGG